MNLTKEQEEVLELVGYWRRKNKKGEIQYSVKLPTGGGYQATKTTTEEAARQWAAERMFSKWAAAQTSPTLHEYAKGFFEKTSPYMQLLESIGHKVTEKYRRNQAEVLDDYILRDWGDSIIPAISTRSINLWLHGLRSVKIKANEILSGPRRNLVRQVFLVVMEEAKNDRLISENPIMGVKRAIVSGGEVRETFSLEKIKTLFPAQDAKLPQIWGSLNNACYYMIQAFCGLRPNEVSALKWNDWHPEFNAFLVKSALDPYEGIVDGIKTRNKGMAEKPAAVPDRLAKLLIQLPTFNTTPDSLVFVNLDGEAIEISASGKLFKRVVRRILPGVNRPQYCLRHTFNTMAMEDKVNRDAVKTVMGHKTDAMNDHYNHPEMKKLLAEASANRDQANARWIMLGMAANVRDQMSERWEGGSEGKVEEEQKEA